MYQAKQIAGRRVLVTGASGFIGSHLCERLADVGAVVYGVSRDKQSGAKHNAEWWQRDLTDLTAVREVFRAVSPELVFHLASYVTGSRELKRVLPTFYSNLATTVHVLTVATEME